MKTTNQTERKVVTMHENAGKSDRRVAVTVAPSGRVTRERVVRETEERNITNYEVRCSSGCKTIARDVQYLDKVTRTRAEESKAFHERLNEGHSVEILSSVDVVRRNRERAEQVKHMTNGSARPRTVGEPKVPALYRHVAVRARVQRDLDRDPVEEYFDWSTLRYTAEEARRMAQAQDDRDRREIHRGLALPHVRIARIRIEEVR